MDQVVAAVLGILVTQTGRAVVYLLSFGRWRGEALTGDEGRVHGAAGALWFRREGRAVFTHTGQFFVGVAFYVALVVVAALAYAVG
jgi:hypothetical protein